MPNPVTASLDTASAIAKAIDRVADLIAQILSGAALRRLQYRIEAAINYVFVDEKSGQYKDISEEKRKEYKIHFRKRIFDEN